MPAKPLPDAVVKEAVRIWTEHSFSKAKAAQHLKIPETTFVSRLKMAERRGWIDTTNKREKKLQEPKISHSARLSAQITDGVVIIGSDAHYWPGAVSTAHRAFIKIIKDLQPSIVIMNGDVLDGAGISRHPPIGWEKKPELIDEIEECQVRLEDICLAAPKARKIWTLGNHDSRFETRLATVAPQYAHIKGIHLKDHFPDWEPCWSTWINDKVVVKHRYKGGIHATHNNTVTAGKTIITGHLHSLKVTPFTDYNHTRWGVDSGTLAPLHPMVGDQFLDYLEDGPVNWRAGFVVLTFHKNRLLWPELVHVINEREYEFRGKVYRV